MKAGLSNALPLIQLRTGPKRLIEVKPKKLNRKKILPKVLSSKTRLSKKNLNLLIFK